MSVQQFQFLSKQITYLFVFALRSKHSSLGILKDFVNNVLIQLIKVPKYEQSADPSAANLFSQKVA